MALVSQNIVDQWFKRDSWVYKHFAYLFSNPVWNCKVPSGYSLCPYFWMAMFSMLFFRPFIVPAIIGMKLIAKKLSIFGRVFKHTDKWIVENGFCKDGPIGFPTVFFTVIFTLFLAMITGFCILIYTIIKSYYNANILSALILPITLAATFISCCVYIDKKKYNSERCNVRYHLHIVMVLCVALAYIISPKEFLWAVNDIWMMFTLIVSEIYGSILSGIKIIASYSLSALKYVVGLFLMLGLNILLFFIGIIIVGYIGLKITDHAAQETPEPKKDIDPNILRRMNVIDSQGGQYKHAKDTVYIKTSESYEFWKANLKHIDYRPVYEQYYLGNINLETLEKKLKAMANQYISDYYVKRRDEEKKREKYKSEWNKTCRKFTDVLIKITNVIVVPVAWLWKQSKIWFAMMREVIGARKQGFCPYKKFQD